MRRVSEAFGQLERKVEQEAGQGGHMAIPSGPGLGIRIDEDAVMRGAATGHRWRPPLWRHGDGSFAEW